MRFKGQWLFVVQATIGATLAWVIATKVLSHPQPFFAPAASLIVLNQARGQRMRRAVDIWIAVAAGVLIADLVAGALGRRSTLTILVVVMVTLALSVVFKASPFAMAQATTSGLYVVVIVPTAHSWIPLRFVDALVGGGVALAISQLATFRDPLAPLKAEVRATCQSLPSVFEEMADAIEAVDESRAREAFDKAGDIGAAVESMQTAASAAGESLLLHHGRRAHLGAVRSVETLSKQIDHVAQSTTSLARTILFLTRRTSTPQTELAESVRALSEASSMTGSSLSARLAGNDEEADAYALQIVSQALASVEKAAQTVEETGSVAVTIVVGQVRMTAIDFMRIALDDDTTVLQKVDEAFGPAIS